MSVAVHSVQRVQNAFLWGCYTLKKEETSRRFSGATEKELFHATSSTNAQSICKINFNWRLSRRVKFGSGVSFSPSAAYANRECNRAIGNYNRAMIVAKVIIGATCRGSQGLKIPSGSVDTSVGNSGSVYVKYYDHEFYPMYIAYYNSNTPSTRSYGLSYHFDFSDFDDVDRFDDWDDSD